MFFGRRVAKRESERRFTRHVSQKYLLKEGNFMQKTIQCDNCHEIFEVVGSTNNSKTMRDVPTSVKCAECGAVNVVTWPDRAQCFVRKAD